jgi:hypothetical protein
MKCVKNHTGDIKRVSNEQAERLVSNGVHTYCPKSEWKALRVAPVVAIVHTDEQKREIQRKADKRKQERAKKDYRKG